MSFAFGLITTAHAQNGYPGGGPGWVAQPVVVNGVTYPAAVTGTVKYTHTDAQGNTTGGTGDYFNNGSSPPPVGVGPGESVTYKVNGTVTYTWKWNGGPLNEPPHSPQGVREYATAGAHGWGDARGTVTATASDGFGDVKYQRTVSPDGKTQDVSDGGGGSHLVTVDGSSGTLTVVGTVSAEIDLSEPASSSYPGGGYPGSGYPGGGYPGSGGSGTLSGNAGCYFTAALDDRSVAISSSLEPTWRKDLATGLPVQNVRAASGFMVADTLAPDTSTTLIVRYFPIYDGNQWGSNSQYLWHFNGSTGDSSGVFNTWFSPDVSSPFASYENPPINPGSNDYISLTLTDSTDGSTASNNYSVLFHDYYEQWKRTATKTHPGAFINPDGSQNAEWTRLVVNDNNSPASPTLHLSKAYSSQITLTASIGGQGSLTAAGVLAFQKNENITNGKTVTGTVTTTYDFAGSPWSRIAYYVAPTYEERTGTTDAYLGNGFQGIQAWYGVFATDPMVESLHSELEQSYPPH